MKEFSSLGDKNLKNLILMSLFSKSQLKYKIENQTENIKKFLDLFLKLTTNSKYSINMGILNFIPGKIEGGNLKLNFKNISEIVMPVIIFGLYSKFGIDLELNGVTNSSSIISVNQEISARSIDLIQLKFNKITKKLGLNIKIDIKKRGFEPIGEGIVKIKVDKIRELSAISFIENELFYKIRGLIITARISADFTHRIVEKIKENLEGFNDLKIANILNNRNNSGPSPGYECSLYAESKTAIISTTVNNQKLPELMADECCKLFLKKINKKIIFDEDIVEFLIMTMCLGTGISLLRLPRLNKSEIELLGFAKHFLNIVYELIKEEDKSIILKIQGIGYKNSAREI